MILMLISLIGQSPHYDVIYKKLHWGEGVALVKTGEK